jgi:hypothetical protein
MCGIFVGMQPAQHPNRILRLHRVKARLGAYSYAASFFRDEETFETLATRVIPRFFEGKMCGIRDLGIQC